LWRYCFLLFFWTALEIVDFQREGTPGFQNLSPRTSSLT
jgi:hypothetical protein